MKCLGCLGKDYTRKKATPKTEVAVRVCKEPISSREHPPRQPQENTKDLYSSFGKTMLSSCPQDPSSCAVASDRTGQGLSCSCSKIPWRYCGVNYIPNSENYMICHCTLPLAGCPFAGCCAQVFKSQPNYISLLCLFFPPLLVVNHLAPAKPFLKYTLLLSTAQMKHT